MKVEQLKTIIQSFAEFGSAACDAEAFQDLRDFAAIFPSGDETTAKFITRLKKGLPKGETFSCPNGLWMRLKGMETCLDAAGAKSGADLSAVLAIFTESSSASAREFIASLIAARDYVAPPKPVKVAKTPKAPKTPKDPKPRKPKVGEIVANYIESLQRTASLSAAEFGGVFDSLKADDGLSDASVKKISKTLWGRPAKSRAEAFDHIQAFRNREALTASSLKALDAAPI
jgi:hypothetical protein